MPFPNKINASMPVAAEGDFASANTYASALNPIEASFVTGANGVTVGRFAWADANGIVSNTGTGAPTGFVHRHQTAMITQWLAENGNVIMAGQPIDLMSRGDFWVKTATAATIGQKVFANLTDGSISTGAAGATVSGSIETKWEVASAGDVGDAIKITTWGNH